MKVVEKVMDYLRWDILWAERRRRELVGRSLRVLRDWKETLREDAASLSLFQYFVNFSPALFISPPFCAKYPNSLSFSVGISWYVFDRLLCVVCLLCYKVTYCSKSNSDNATILFLHRVCVCVLSYVLFSCVSLCLCCCVVLLLPPPNQTPQPNPAVSHRVSWH